MKKLQQILMLATCMFVLMVAAIRRDGKVWGRSIKTMLADSVKTAKIDTMRTLDDGTKVINTTKLGKDIVGYSGAVPLDIYIKDGKVVQVKALKNAETPEFFEQVKPLLTKWNGHRTSTGIEGRCHQWSNFLVARYHRKYAPRLGLCREESNRTDHIRADEP